MDTTPRPDLPGCAVAFIDLVVKKIRYRKKVRQEVRDELAAHFEDELRDCTDVEDRDRKAQQRIADFGDPKVLAALMRRAKKRCRPLWAKVAVHGLQAVGAMILYLVICSLPLMIGRPTIRVNYLDWVNNLVRAGQDEALNAKPYYDKAVELVAKAPDWPPELKAYRTTWPGDMNDRERKATAEFLDQSREALDTLREAVKKPSYWVRYQFSPEYTRADNQGHPLSFSAGLVDQATKPLAGRRDLIRRLELQCIWKTWNGDTDGALDDASALLRSGLHLQGKGTLVEQLVGISVEALANRQTLHVLTRSDTTAEDVKRIQDELDEFYAAQETVLSLDVEKALLLEYVQRTFTDDGKGNGRVLAHGIPLVTSDWKDSLAGLLLFRYPDRQETSKRIEDCYTTLERTMNLMPSSPESEVLHQRLNEITSGNMLLQVTASALERVGGQVWRLKTGRAALVSVLGVLRYRKETGQDPNNLSEVVAAGCLDAVPTDPYSGGPLVYRRTDGGFLLYSVGENRRDDGGVLGTDSGGQPKMWSDNGDWVFWPVTD